MRLFIVITILLIQMTRVHAQVPTNSLLRIPSVQKFVKNYQRNHRRPGPSSFLVNVTELRDYLLRDDAPAHSYLHIYFAAPGGVQNATYLVLVGTVPDGMNNAKHDINNYVWRSTNAQPNCCVLDYNIDWDTDYYSNCSLVCTSGQCEKNNVKKDVADYQNLYGDSYTKSFFINAEDLRDYLKDNPTIEYLHLYLGWDDNMPDRDDKMTVIIFGAKPNTGGTPGYQNDYYFESYAFNESFPCPKCAIANDVEIDPGIGRKKRDDRYGPPSPKHHYKHGRAHK